MNRVILHVDIDAFFATVEELENPALKDKPLIVGGSPQRRGVVASANYAARAFGVRAAMTTAQGLRRCPQATVCPPRRDLYRQYAERVRLILLRFSPLVEQSSMDEAFVDLSNSRSGGDAPAAARQMQNRIRAELGLSVSIGVAANKLVAKMASSLHKPGGLTVVPPGTEAEFLAVLPVQTLWGVGEKTAEQLGQAGVSTVGQLARLPEKELVGMFGENGAKLWRYARGVDSLPVKPQQIIKSMSREVTFEQDVSQVQILHENLLAMSRDLARQLRLKKLTARTVTLKIRYTDFSTRTRSQTHDPPTDNTDVIYHRSVSLLQQHWNAARPLRLVGVSVEHLVEGVQQPSLFNGLADG